MKVTRIVLHLLVFFTCLSSLNGAERVALVIGNGSYQHSARLDNPVNDGTDIASSLKECGFEVIGGGCASDLSHESMSKKLAEFKTAAAQAKVALFFFAGHGLEVDGSNYLLPVDAQIEEKFQVKHRALALDEVLESMVGEDRLKIVILDCCRNNPLGRSWGRSGAGGLAAPTSTPGGTILVFSTAPGKTAEDGTGRNSPFSAVLKEALKTPGSNIENVFKKVGAQVKLNTRTQEPWMNSNYYGEFAFAKNQGSQPTLPSLEQNRNGEIKGKVFTSPTTRQEFVLIGRNSSNRNIFMCRWETRIKDWEKFSKDPGYKEFLSASGAKPSSNWQTPFNDLSPPYDQTADEPVVCISLRQAKAFCAWLSKMDGMKYRVPTDEEWNLAVGVVASSATMPFEQDRMENRKYPWGGYFPPRKGDGNYYGAENGNTEFPNDGYRYTAPVGKFSGNAFGIFDLGGNASEVCDTKYNPSSGSGEGTSRGGNWSEEIPDMLTSDHRDNGTYNSAGDVYSNTIGFRIVLIE